jgi:transglutaminase-like putative cysteine protease
VPVTTVSDEATSGLFYTLEDHQQRVTESSIERYYHESYRVTSHAGLDAGSQIKPEFDPTYEELIFHSISIKRGDKSINALRPREIKLIQQENNLDEREYNGRISALVFLNDVRVGDVVDCEYSVNGSNPVMRGRFAGRFYLIGDGPIQLLRRRLLWGSARSLHFKSFNTKIEPAVREVGAFLEYTWQREDVASMQVDDSIPDWFNPYPMVQLSDFNGWDDVTGWAVPLFRTELNADPELVRQIMAWKGASPDAGDRLLAALRFVQDDVRYLAIEIGAYSNRPNPPSTVFKRRYGDCKDKSLLLVTMLNALGIESYPALVSAKAQNQISSFQPSPFAFDHCIVKAIYGGKTLWLDPTTSLQRGTIEGLSGQDEGFALVLKEGGRALEVIPAPPNDHVLVTVNEIYAVDGYGAAASLEVITTFHNAEADAQRYWLTRHPVSEVAKDFLNYYAHTDASISADGPPTVTDDPVQNSLVISERYKIPDFWSGGDRELFADRINQELERPSITQRGMPLAISYPAYVEQTIELRSPNRPSIRPASGTLSDEAVHFEYKVDLSGNAVRLKYIYRTLQDHLDATRVAGHLELIEHIRSALSQRVRHSDSSSGSEEMSGTAAVMVIGVLAAPFVIIGLVMGVRRSKKGRRLRAFRQALQIDYGAGPENPVHIASEAVLPDLLRSLRCRCGAAYFFGGNGMSRQTLMYDGRRLIAVTLSCNSCGSSLDRYFAPSDVP